MYRLNRTSRNVLITPDEVIFHAPTATDVGERQILNNIIIAEERFISEELGHEFYEKLINLKNVEVTAENKTDLLEKVRESYLKQNINFKDDNLQEGMIVNALEFIEDEWLVKLWKQYLWKITAECVDFVSVVPSWLQTTAAGQQTKNPRTISSTDSASGSRNDVVFKMQDSIQERIGPMISRMHEWICRNKVYFPLYKKDCGHGCFGDKVEYKSTNSGFAFGHYD